MPTTQSKSDPITESVQGAADRVSELHEKAIAQSKKASEAYLSSYEQAVVTLADQYEKATSATNVEWIVSIGSLQAGATREIARAYTSAVREFVS
ncbi:MAG TPA: hypothetical protein VMA76_07035 [Solirubrobacteraceae bacterium]|nr:hypothetical protein [Solirubrobacteraceae bacterium]